MKILREILSPLIAVIAAFIVGGIIVLLIGDNPFQTFYQLVGNSFGSLNSLGYTLFIATPLIFTGLAVAVAFRCGLLNIGAEGQLYVAAFATAWVGIKFGGTVVNVFGKQEDWSWMSLPAFLLIPLCMLTAVVVGGLWGAIPGYLKAKFGSHEVINTIMLNFIAIALVSYFTQYYYKVPGDPILQTAPIGEAARIPRISQFIPGMSDFVPLSIAFLIAVLMCVLVYIFLWKTKWGYELRAVGQNPSAAEYGGISPKKQIIIAMTISGALAGMVAIGEVMGNRYLYYHDFSGEVGFLGIAVALLGRNHPLGVFIAAIFFAILSRGGIFVDAFTEHVSKDLVEVLQAIVILFVASLQRFSKKIKMGEIFSIALFFDDSFATPLIFAALGGMFSERSGVINIALEGLMLAGAFTAAVVTYETSNPFLGLLCGIVAGAALAFVYAVSVIKFEADQVVAGFGINILMLGLPALLSSAIYDSAGSTEQLAKENVLPSFFDINIASFLAFALVPVCWYVLYKTPFGLRLRAVGENPSAADAAGVSVIKLRYFAVILSGVLAAAGGAYLSIGQSSLFTRGMTAGRGFIALAALILAKWRPVPVLLACLFFGFTEALTIPLASYKNAAGEAALPVQFVQIIPYVLTIIVLAGFIGTSRAPKALGIPYSKEK